MKSKKTKFLYNSDIYIQLNSKNNKNNIHQEFYTQDRAPINLSNNKELNVEPSNEDCPVNEYENLIKKNY